MFCSGTKNILQLNLYLHIPMIALNYYTKASKLNPCRILVIKIYSGFHVEGAPYFIMTVTRFLHMPTFEALQYWYRGMYGICKQIYSWSIFFVLEHHFSSYRTQTNVHAITLTLKQCLFAILMRVKVHNVA